MTKEEIQDYTLKITQANGSRLIVIIYELAVKYLEDAEKSYAEENFDNYKENVGAAEKCISTLSGIIDENSAIYSHLTSLYIYYIKELSLAMIMRDLGKLQAVKKQLTKLKDAFSQAADKDTSQPVMSNSQTVYAGLTYGRNQLNESLAESNNRGYMV